MFKRVRWIGTGVAIGFGGSLWLQRKLKEMSSRYGPVGMAGAAASRARDALVEGRQAMRDREAELRAPARPAGQIRHISGTRRERSPRPTRR